MKVVLLAGGFGTRLAEFTEVIPKPMVQIGGMPIIWHIMQRFQQYGHSDFYLALGYKADVIKQFFLNYKIMNSDFTVNLASGKIDTHQQSPVDWKVTLVETGYGTMTGGRVKRLRSYLGNETFLLTYGDGVANVDIHDLISFHRKHRKMITVSAVRPAARFGELEIDGDRVLSFEEKPQLQSGWINGGYFVVEPAFLDLIAGDDTLLEREPLEKAAAMGELMAYRHHGFWQCMDTKRDRDLLEDLWKKGAPWKV